MIHYNGLKGKNYFEGWFFRICADDFNCAFIPSFALSDGKAKAYIQLNLDDFQESQEYDYRDFKADNNTVSIGANTFSTKGINFSSKNLTLSADFGAFNVPKRDIMGCFKFGTPCKHKLISMTHTVNGVANFRGKQIQLDNALGYIEKDYGKTFPKGYVWLQCNDFAANASFFCSIAKIGFPFLGLICVLLLDGKEYRFATYNFAQIKKLSRGEIVLKKGAQMLIINFKESNANSLLAPDTGKMTRSIKEGLNGKITLTLFENGVPKCTLHGKNAGIEWVNLP